MVTKTRSKKRTKKIPFSQREYDRLLMKMARRGNAYRESQKEVKDYEKTHTSGIRR